MYDIVNVVDVAVDLQKVTGLTIALCIYLLKKYGVDACFNTGGGQ